MQIQNNTNVNFQAKRIMSVDKHFNCYHSPKTEVFDIFKLDKARDLNFIKQCYAMLKTRKTRDLNSVQKNLKVFFESFLQEYRDVSVSRLVERTHEQNGAWAKVFKNGLGIWDTIDFRLIQADCDNARS